MAGAVVGISNHGAILQWDVEFINRAPVSSRTGKPTWQAPVFSKPPRILAQPDRLAGITGAHSASRNLCWLSSDRGCLRWLDFASNGESGNVGNAFETQIQGIDVHTAATGISIIPMVSA